MIGRLKNDLRIGNGCLFGVKGKIDVEIIDEENHPIYGKRYKIPEYDVWFEENAFEYIIEEDNKNGR